MKLECKYEYDQHVKHRLSEFEGYIVGILFRPTSIEYEILPVTDEQANWRNPVWIDEIYLERK